MRHRVAAVAALFVIGCSPSAPTTSAPETAVSPVADAQTAQAARDAEIQREKDEQARIARETQAAVQAVLDADVVAGSASDSATVAARMAAIDLANTPGEFRSAYLDHTEAWRQLGRVDTALAQLKSDEGMQTAAAKALLSTIFGTPDTPFSDQLAAINELQRRRPEFREAVVSSYAAVKSAAARYLASPRTLAEINGSTVGNSM